MPFSMRLEDGAVVGTCSGDLGLEDARAGARAVWDNLEWRGLPVVWDLRSAQLKVGAADVREIAEFILGAQPSPPPSKVAFVTTQNVDFGMIRMFQVFREHPATKVRVFRDYEEALTWARARGARSA
jgi:hypothetical protein